MLRPMDDGSGRWEALVRPSRRVAVGDPLTLRSGDTIEVGERLGAGTRAVRFARDPLAVMEAAGEMPLPPYIRDRSSAPERYQTVYARPPGSAAAPTAGLHFTERLLADLAERGVRPRDGDPARRPRHLPPAGGRVRRRAPDPPRVVRDPARHGARHAGRATPRTGGSWRWARPPCACSRPAPTAARPAAGARSTSRRRTSSAAVDALITNFHLPRSSLLLLVTAFVQAGMRRATPYQARDTLLAAYRTALDEGYRFFSFGDAMLIV